MAGCLLVEGLSLSPILIFAMIAVIVISSAHLKSSPEIPRPDLPRTLTRILHVVYDPERLQCRSHSIFNLTNPLARGPSQTVVLKIFVSVLIATALYAGRGEVLFRLIFPSALIHFHFFKLEIHTTLNTFSHRSRPLEILSNFYQRT
jgi:hypothetical protein